MNTDTTHVFKMLTPETLAAMYIEVGRSEGGNAFRRQLLFEIESRARERDADQYARFMAIVSGEVTFSVLDEMFRRLIDAHYGTDLHHIGDGDGLTGEEAEDIRRYIRKE